MTTPLKTMSALAIAAATLTAATLATGSTASANPFRHLGGYGLHTPAKLPPVYGKFGSHLNITCLACNLPRPKPTHPKPTHNWNHGWDHWYGWRNRREFYGEGRPEAVTMAAPAQSAPAYAPAASQADASPCNCLTKQNMPDGSVMFQDICTKQSAIMPPVTVGAR